LRVLGTFKEGSRWDKKATLKEVVPGKQLFLEKKISVLSPKHTFPVKYT